jgi:hypothetical protein
MKKALLSAAVVLCLLGVSALRGAEIDPEFRPALVGNGPKSLVNRIDAQDLIRAGQGDAVVMFDQLIFPFEVKGRNAAIYRGTPGSQPLQRAVLKALDGARFIPATIDHKPAAVDFHGTVMFFPHQTPNLRVFANQDRKELARFADFVAPQLIGGSTKFDGKDPALEAARRMKKDGMVVLSLQVNEKGELLASRIISEEPPGFGFGAAILKSYKIARFIPGFHDGKLTACTFEITEPVSPYGRYRGAVSFR